VRGSKDHIERYGLKPQTLNPSLDHIERYGLESQTLNPSLDHIERYGLSLCVCRETLFCDETRKI